MLLLDAPRASARTRPAAAALTADAVAVAGVVAFFAVLVLLTWNTWGDAAADTGYDVVAAERLVSGQLPYLDFDYYYGPLGVSLLAGLMVVLGTGMQTAVVLGIAIALGIVLATYALARELCAPLPAALAAGIVVPLAVGPDNFGFIQPHSLSAPLAVLAALLACVAAVRYARSGGTGALAGAGVAAGAALLARPDAGLVVVIALALWIAMRGRAGAPWRREAATAGIAVLAAGVLPYVVLAAAVGPRELLLSNLWPVDLLGEGGREVLALSAPMTLGSVAELVLRTALYAAGAALLVAAGLALDGPPRRRRAAAVIAVAAGVAGVAVLAADPALVRYGLEFVYGWIPLGAAIAVVVLARRWWRRRDGEAWTAEDQAALLVALVLAGLAVRTYGAFFAHATVAQQAVYAMPFAAVFLAWLHTRELGRSRGIALLGTTWLAFLVLAGGALTLQDAGRKDAAVAGPGGELRDTPARAAVYQDVVDEVLARTDAGDEILVAPQLSWMHVLTERQSPLSQISLLPGALPDPAAEDAAAGILERADVRVVVIDRRALTPYGHGAFGETFDQRLSRWVQDEYTRVATYGGPGQAVPHIDVWERTTT